MFEPMPLVGSFCESADEASRLTRYPFTLVWCTACGLAQALEDIDDHVLFGSYHYKSSSILGVVRHFSGYADELVARYGRGRVRLLEVGCNDGVLLRRLPESWRLVGVDPSDVAAAADARTYELVNDHFSARLAAEIARDDRFDVIVSSNCVAHVTDMRDVLAGMADLLVDGGELWIEAHDLEAVLSGQWDAMYHEHKGYWSADSLSGCAARLGLVTDEVTRLPVHGGLLRARLRKTARLPRPPAPRRPPFEGVVRAYEGRRSTATYDTLMRAHADGRRVAGYGASGRAAVWFNQLPEIRPEYVVDDSPLRANLWMAGVALPIVEAPVFRGRPPDVCVITAWNYADDIRARHDWYSGEWLQSFAQAARPAN